MDTVQHLHGRLDRKCAVGELRPLVFGVRIDGRRVLSQREFDSHKRVGMGIRKVMHHLSNGPAALAVGGLELRFGDPLDGTAYFGRKLRNHFDPGIALLRSGCRNVLELADGETRVARSCWLHVAIVELERKRKAGTRLPADGDTLQFCSMRLPSFARTARLRTRRTRATPASRARESAAGFHPCRPHPEAV